MSFLGIFNVLLAVLGVVVMAVAIRNLLKTRCTQRHMNSVMSELYEIRDSGQEIKYLAEDLRRMQVEAKTRLDNLHVRSSKIETELIGIRSAANLGNAKAVNARCDSVLSLLREE